MGKTLNSDFTLNKKTFLYLKAKEIIPEKLDKVFNSNNHLLNYKKMLINEGIVDLTELYIDKIFTEAIDCLLEVKLCNDNLFNFLNYIRNRKC